MRKIVRFFLFITLLSNVTEAQDSIRVGQIDVSMFKKIKMYVNVYDKSGNPFKFDPAKELKIDIQGLGSPTAEEIRKEFTEG